MKRILLFILTLLLVCGLISCKKTDLADIMSPETQENAANQNQMDDGNTFTRTEDPIDHTITLEAFPSENYGFIGWSSDPAGNDIVSYYNPYVFSAAEESTLYPVFIHEDQVIQFKDRQIESSMQNLFGKSAITYGELRPIKTYTIYSPERLEDLVYFSSLEELSVSLSEDVNYDLSPIANLINIEKLSIWGTPVNMLPIENYKNLRNLCVSYSGEDGSFLLSQKDTLEYLYLTDASIENYKFLSQFTKLENFYFRHSSVENLLTCLPVSLKYLNIDNCTGLTDLNALTKYTDTNLRVLQISRCWISDITPIAQLKNLTGLYLEHNLISDLSPLSELHNLTSLALEDNRISDLSPLENIFASNQLKYFTILFNPIVDYSCFENSPAPTDPTALSSREWILKIIQLSKDIIADNTIQPDMTDEEKYWALAVALCQNIYPSYPRAAEAYMAICAMSGLPCYYISSSTSRDEYHIWNIIKLEGYYYHVDIECMFRNYDGYDKDYFIKSDDFIREHWYHGTVTDHITSLTVAPDLICNDTSKDNLEGGA